MNSVKFICAQFVPSTKASGKDEQLGWKSLLDFIYVYEHACGIQRNIQIKQS